MDIHLDQKDYSESNSKKKEDNNFPFTKRSEKKQQIKIKDNRMKIEKKDSIKAVLLDYQQNISSQQNCYSSPLLENNSNKDIKVGNFSQFYQSSGKQKKNININFQIIKKDNDKEDYFKLSEEKLKQNRTYKKECKIINNLHNLNFNSDNEQDLNISLSNIEVTKSNFIHDFSNFLNKMDIKIVNNFPVSLKEKNKHYFQQTNFWLLIMNYLFFQNNSLSLYTIISLLEQCILWSTDLNLENFNSIKERIKEYLNSNHTLEDLSKFLFMNKLKNIDDIFEKYENGIKNRDMNFKEIKISNLNLSKNEEMKCNCELCINDDACIRKVSEINKRKINEVKNENLIYKREIEHISEYDQSLNNISNNQELFYKGKSKKNTAVFSKSKTIFSENSNLEYNLINKIKNLDSRHLEEEEKDDVFKEKTYKNISKNKSNKNKNENKKEKEKDDLDKKEIDKEEDEENNSENKNKKKLKKTKKEKNSRNKKIIKYSKSIKTEENEEKEEEKKMKKKKDLAQNQFL